jgi:hypothetical protein
MIKISKKTLIGASFAQIFSVTFVITGMNHTEKSKDIFIEMKEKFNTIIIFSK